MKKYKHTYKSGIDLFKSNYISFTIKHNGKLYGHIITCPESSKLFSLRGLVMIKHQLVAYIQTINKANSAKTKLNKYKV